MGFKSNQREQQASNYIMFPPSTKNVTSSSSSSMSIDLSDNNMNKDNNDIDDPMGTSTSNSASSSISACYSNRSGYPSNRIDVEGSSAKTISIGSSNNNSESSTATTKSVSRDMVENSQHFPTNLHDLLDEAEKGNHSHIVSWTSQGQAFKIYYDQQDNISVSFPLLLEKYNFRQTKFKAFLHQLQSYNFHRTSLTSHRQGVVISHPLFIRGRRALCLRMSQRKPAPPKSSSSGTMNRTSMQMNGMNNMTMNKFKKINSAPVFGMKRKAITDLSQMKNATFSFSKQEEGQEQQPMMMGVGMRSFTTSSYHRPRRSSSATPPVINNDNSIPVLNPCTYMMDLLIQTNIANNKIKKTPPIRRIDSFSTEQASYFEPYQQSEIKIELLKALRTSNLDQLRSLIQVTEETTTSTTTNQRMMSEYPEHEEEEEVGRGSTNVNQSATAAADAAAAAAAQPLLQLQDLKARNQFGENLLHLACRMGISRDVLEFLVDGPAKVPLNIRDKFGRTPLHNSCMSTVPNFQNIEYVIFKAPRMLLFEDDTGKIPFELIPPQCYEQWTQFLVLPEEEEGGGGRKILIQAAQAISW